MPWTWAAPAVAPTDQTHEQFGCSKKNGEHTAAPAVLDEQLGRNGFALNTSEVALEDVSVLGLPRREEHLQSGRQN